MDATMLLIAVVILFFCVASLGDVVLKIQYERTRDRRLPIIVKNEKASQYLSMASQHEGFCLMMKWHPENYTVDEFKYITEFMKENDISLKQFEIDELLKHEKRQEVLDIVGTWNIIP